MIREITLAVLMAHALPALAQMPANLRDGVPPAKKPAAPAAPAKAGGAPAPAANAALDHAVLVQRYGTIVESRPVGVGGLTAWTVEKGGRRVVLYTTADGQAVISGVVWEAVTGRNMSDQFVPAGLPGKAPVAAAGPAVNMQQALAGNGVRPVMVSGPATAPPVGALVGKFSGKVPESILTIESLAGVKEGSGGPGDTLYVVFDPRCPYCRKAYNNLRPYVKKGFTVKWIPVVALADPASGTPVTASVLQVKPGEQADMLRRVLGNKEEVRTVPSKAVLAALDRNLAFFYAAFKNNNVDKVGVPAAFFLDKRTGNPRMMTGIQEMPVIEEVFGRLP